MQGKFAYLVCGLKMIYAEETLQFNGYALIDSIAKLKSHKSHYFYGFPILFYILKLRPSFKLNKLF